MNFKSTDIAFLEKMLSIPKEWFADADYEDWAEIAGRINRFGDLELRCAARAILYRRYKLPTSRCWSQFNNARNVAEIIKNNYDLRAGKKEVLQSANIAMRKHFGLDEKPIVFRRLDGKFGHAFSRTHVITINSQIIPIKTIFFLLGVKYHENNHILQAVMPEVLGERIPRLSYSARHDYYITNVHLPIEQDSKFSEFVFRTFLRNTKMSDQAIFDKALLYASR